MGRKGIAASTIGLVLLGVAGVIGGAGFLIELRKVLELIISNVFYLSIIGITLLLGLVLFSLVRQGRVSPRQAGIGGVLLLIVAFAGPVGAIKVGSLGTSHAVVVEVQTSQVEFGLSEISFDGIAVVETKEVGPQFLRTQEACTIGCQDFTVKLEVFCGSSDEPIRTVEVTGSGGDDPQRTIDGLPGSTECEVVGEMTRPSEDKIDGLTQHSKIFITG